MDSKKELIDQLYQVEQLRGSLTLLFTNSIAQNIGLSATEFECLDIIGNNQPITAGELGKLSGLSSGGVTGVVDRLERSGFAKRHTDPKDRRRVLLARVSEHETIQKVDNLHRPLAQGFESICQKFTTRELALILHYMQESNVLTSNLIQLETISGR